MTRRILVAVVAVALILGAGTFVMASAGSLVSGNSPTPTANVANDSMPSIVTNGCHLVIRPEPGGGIYIGIECDF